jgi:predicted Zn-dependent protease
MRGLHRADPDRLAYRLALARIQRQAGQLEPALGLYKSGLELYPGELTLVLPYANTLMAAGNSEQAFTLLADISSNTSGDPAVYKLLAQAAGKTNRPLQTHTAMAEYYYLNGYTQQAVEQMELAKKTPRLNDYQAARIQARLIALEKALKEKEKN